MQSVSMWYGYNLRKRIKREWNMRKVRKLGMLLLVLERSANISQFLS